MIKRRRRPGSAAALAAAAALLITACGSDPEFPPPAEPAVAPEPTAEPVGAVIELPGEGEAEGVVADPETGLAAVGTRDPDALFLVADPLSRRPDIRRIEIPESVRHLQLAEPGGPVLGTAERTDTLLEVTLPTGKVRTTPVGDFPHDATAAAGGIFVADEGGDTISVVEGGAVRAALPAPEQPGGIAAAGDSVGVIAVAERTLATYDARTLEGTGEVGAGVGPTHIVASDGRFYVADTQGDAILVFESGPEPRLIDRANLPGAPYGIAIDASGERLWVTQTERNRVVELELTDLAPRRLASFPTVQQPNSVTVDPNTGYVYVAGRTGGVLQVFDPRRTQPEEEG
jgi:DNA-binding beta-propeller fold protein YncE